ncbi:MAG: alpha/beta hydrolase [Frankiaceae bacterium]|nr:alpha/beta hydrolase [Frankiaceae bacterium]MBV9869967.1 alpha/beta hydrolase [Frankiaceae bacterium]
MTGTTTISRHRPVNESYRSFGDVRTRVLEVAGSGPPLVCLHGYSDQADTWRPLMRALRAADRRVIAVDLPGFGRASALQPGLVLPQLDRFVAETVRSAADSAGQAAVVIGNSLGGIAALRAGADRALPIAGVVPISPAGFGHSRALRWAQHSDAVLPMLQRGRLPMPVVRSVMTMAFRRASCGNPRRADHEAVRAYAGQFRTRGDLYRMLSTAPSLLTELGQGHEVSPVDVPVLLLWGDHDRLTLHRGSERVLEVIPHTELVTLAGFGHCPQLEAAPRVAELINDFVDRVTGPSVG